MQDMNTYERHEEPLNKHASEKHARWLKKYKKIAFSKVIFNNKCRATLDGPNDYINGWYFMEIMNQHEFMGRWSNVFE